MIAVNQRVLSLYILNQEVLDFIPSKAVRSFFESPAYNEMTDKYLGKDMWYSWPCWNYMQLATVAVLGSDFRNPVEFMLELADDCPDKTEAELIRTFAEAYKDGGEHHARLMCEKAYESKMWEPHRPFEELLFLPEFFKPGDVVSMKRGEGSIEYFVYRSCPDYGRNLFQSVDDESCYVLSLDGKEDLLDEENCDRWHNHVLPLFLERVEDADVPQEYRDIVNELRTKDIFKKSKPVSRANGSYCKEEMRVRMCNAFENETKKTQRISRAMKDFKITPEFVQKVIRMNDGLRERFGMVYRDMLEMKAVVDAEIESGKIRGISGYSIFPEYFFGYNREEGIPTADNDTLMELSDDTRYMFPTMELYENTQTIRSEDDFVVFDPNLSFNIEDLNLHGLEDHYIYMFMHQIFQDAGTYCIADIQYLEPEDLEWQITVQYEKF